MMLHLTTVITTLSSLSCLTGCPCSAPYPPLNQGIVHGKLSPRSIILADDEEDEESDTQIKALA